MILEIFYHQICLSFLGQLKMCSKVFVIFKFSAFFRIIQLFYQMFQFFFQIFFCIFHNLSINLASNILLQNHYHLFPNPSQHNKLMFLLNLVKDRDQGLHMAFFNYFLSSSLPNSILYSA